METLLYYLKKIIPARLFEISQPIYHQSLARLGGWWYGQPSLEIKIIGVTGTKGKSSTTEIIDAILRAGGLTTAVAGTIRFSLGNNHQPNLFKQTMPGRFFLQRFLRRAVQAGCDWAIIEMTSEGALQFRHWGIFLDALVFTNLTPEHLERHGGFENYKECKLDLARDSLAASPKRPRAMIYHAEDPHSQDFVREARAEEALPFGLSMFEHYHSTPQGSSFSYQGQEFHSALLGEHNLKNLAAGIVCGEFADLSLEEIKRGLEAITLIPGRGQEIVCGQSLSGHCRLRSHQRESGGHLPGLGWSLHCGHPRGLWRGA